MYEKRLKQDWNFTDLAHEIALKDIYPNTSIIKATKIDDLEHGIDYWIKAKYKNIPVQERFRYLSRFTKNSDEFTLRYNRPNSLSQNQIHSEFFKIKACYLLYGITDAENRNQLPKHFIRWCMIYIPSLIKSIRTNKILIDENKNNDKNLPYMYGNKPVAIVKPNHEKGAHNSNLLVFSVSQLLNSQDKLLNNIVHGESGYKILTKQKAYKKHLP